MQKEIQQRKMELGINNQAIAILTGLSVSTVKSFIAGKNDSISLANAIRILDVLGLGLIISPKKSVKSILARQAGRRTRKIVGIVKGTSNLEGMKLSIPGIKEISSETYKRVRESSNKNLWRTK